MVFVKLSITQTHLTTCLCRSTQYFIAFRTIISCFLESPFGLCELKFCRVDGALNWAPQSAFELYRPFKSLSSISKLGMLVIRIYFSIIRFHIRSWATRADFESPDPVRKIAPEFGRYVSSDADSSIKLFIIS